MYHMRKREKNGTASSESHQQKKTHRKKQQPPKGSTAHEDDSVGLSLTSSGGSEAPGKTTGSAGGCFGGKRRSISFHVRFLPKFSPSSRVWGRRWCAVSGRKITTNQSINQSSDHSLNQSVNHSINQSITRSLNVSTASTNQSIEESFELYAPCRAM